jgi:N-acetylmuramoyl-L-alanine amidase
MANGSNFEDVFQGTGDLLVETVPEPADFLIAIDPGHFIGTAGRRTPQMPDLHEINGNLVPNWESENTNSSLATGATAPSTVTTPDGEVTVFTLDGITTPSGWNVSANRANPAHGVIAGVLAEERIQMREWEFNNAVAVHLIGLLETRGYSVLNVAPEDDPLMTGSPPQPGRDNLNGVSNTQRVNRANNHDSAQNGFGRPADFYLSIHANAFGNATNIFQAIGHGLETIIHPNDRGTASEDYARIIDRHAGGLGYNQIVREMKILNFEVIRDTDMPSVIYESGFMTNFTDAVLLMDNTYRQRTAEMLANAIDEIYDMWRDNQP